MYFAETSEHKSHALFPLDMLQNLSLCEVLSDVL